MYRPLLEFTQQFSNLIKLHAGSLPSNLTSISENENPEKALWLAKEQNFIANDVTELHGTDLYYNLYEAR